MNEAHREHQLGGQAFDPSRIGPRCCQRAKSASGGGGGMMVPPLLLLPGADALLSNPSRRRTRASKAGVGRALCCAVSRRVSDLSRAGLH